MKKTIKIIVLAALCLNFSTKALAQSPENKAIDITTKGVQIGQKVPITSALEKYEGKLIILDFWATWCSPCIAMIPKMEALQAQFIDEIQILPVTYQSEQEVMSFLTKLKKGKASNLPQITGDKELHKLFPHVYLPHYVWIDQSGTVKAITGQEEITAQNIEKALSQSNSVLALNQKKDMKIPYDKTKPFLINGNGGDGRNLIYHSLLTGYTEGLTSTITFRTNPDKSRYVNFSNISVRTLYQRAYSTYDTWFSNNRIILEVKDATGISSGKTGQAVLDWLQTNGYCYELILPPHLATNAGPIMQQEFDKLIPQYKAAIVKRKIKCLALVRTSSIDKIANKAQYAKPVINRFTCEFKGTELSFLLLNLNALIYQHSKLPLINLTGYTGKTDLSIKTDLSNIDEFNKALEAYDLKFEERETELDMLVISDRDTIHLN